MIEITNQQKIKRLNTKNIRCQIKVLLSLLSIPSKKISFLFCDNAFITELNKRIFAKSNPTDVISFNLTDKHDPNYLGEVVISVEEAINNCSKYKNCWQKELLTYIIHGVLHILGYKDYTPRQRKKMYRLQEELLKKIW